MTVEHKTAEALVLSPEKVSAQATQIATDTLVNYSSDDKFKVEDNRENGNGTVEVSIDWDHRKDHQHFMSFQTLEFTNDTLTDVSAEHGGNYYGYYPDKQTITMGTGMTANGNAQWHMIDCIIAPKEQYLEEVTRVQVHTDLRAKYQPVSKNGSQGFELDSIGIIGRKLPNEDIAKFLPNGRSIALDDVLASTIDPYRSNQGFKKRVTEISKADGFPKFHYADMGPHAKQFARTPDHDADKMLGFVHPLESNPDGWLAFTLFGQEDKESIARVLLVEVDRESVQVENMDGIPTINVKTSVDGEEYKLSIPEARLKWEEKNDDNVHLATRKHKDDDGKEHVLIPITADELRQSIENGYYFSDMVNWALTAFYEKYYQN
jgi:hypothetical protein